MRYVFLLLLFFSMVMAYGYWHSLTHGTLNISVYDFSDRKSYTLVKDMDIVLRDQQGRILARGESDLDYGVVYLSHPVNGSCYEAEHAARRSDNDMNTWQICFEQLSTWIMEWIRELRFAEIKVRECSLENIPVTVKVSSPDWWMWWIPLPHVGGKPYTYFSLTLRIDPLRCTVLHA